MSTDGKDDWRETIQAKRKAEAKERRAALAGSPRMLALKAELKARAKATRKRIADEKKRQRKEAKQQERDRQLADRAEELRATLGARVRPASEPASSKV